MITTNNVGKPRPDLRDRSDLSMHHASQINAEFYCFFVAYFYSDSIDKRVRQLKGLFKESDNR
jgi:hypothetical protein